ncbi:MAG TPA: protein-L-isoaspartate O-methyltransferase [Candidatus Competibacteraceae bacterium]|nr:protein-L-isoaspartate O-methyltransferase [Candidatus Competibacteraceae bacterium]
MSELNFAQARFNMIEQQIRPWEVLDQRVLDVLATVPREDFVPAQYRNLAFADVRIPLGHGQVMMNPNVEGRMLQALAIQPEDRVLEVGTGSGFITACLARLGVSVLSVDIFEDFTRAAQDKLKRHGIDNARLVTGNAARDWGSQRYDVIALTGSLPMLPRSWYERLAIGGRLFAIVGQAPVMEAVLITRSGEQEWQRQSLFDTELPPLLESLKPAEFVF